MCRPGRHRMSQPHACTWRLRLRPIRRRRRPPANRAPNPWTPDARCDTNASRHRSTRPSAHHDAALSPRPSAAPNARREAVSSARPSEQLACQRGHSPYLPRPLVVLMSPMAPSTLLRRPPGRNPLPLAAQSPYSTCRSGGGPPRRRRYLRQHWEREKLRPPPRTVVSRAQGRFPDLLRPRRMSTSMLPNPPSPRSREKPRPRSGLRTHRSLLPCHVPAPACRCGPKLPDLHLAAAPESQATRVRQCGLEKRGRCRGPLQPPLCTTGSQSFCPRHRAR
mmetsp:Transcript_2445/g.6087  ORF Transcript_2445/g.6087 Transcript_2445/m.6087 type:complete len:278 (+) Transcript_2445:563-1396(+)